MKEWMSFTILFLAMYIAGNAQGNWYHQVHGARTDRPVQLLVTSNHVLIMFEMQGGVSSVQQKLVCFSISGDTLWQKVVAAPPSAVFHDEGHAMSNGDFLVGFNIYNYYLTGDHDTDTMVVWRLNPSNGEILWEYKTPTLLTFEADYDHVIYATYEVIEYSQNDIRLYFMMTPFRPGDPWSRKRDGYIVLNGEGSEVRRYYYDRGGKYHWPVRLQKDSLGNLYQGYRTTPFNFEKVWMRVDKMDSTGQILWTHTSDTIYSPGTGTSGGLALDASGNVYYTYLYKDGDNTLEISPSLISLTSDGEFRWKRLYGDYFYLSQGLTKTICDADNRIVSCGYQSNPWFDYTDTGWIVCVDTLGETLWERRYIVEESDRDGSRFYFIEQTSDGGFVLFGMTNINEEIPQTPENQTDALIVKTDNEGCVVPGCGLHNYISFLTATHTVNKEKLKLLLYCTESQLHLIQPEAVPDYERKFIITSLAGIQMEADDLDNGPNMIDVSHLSSGYYIFTMLDEEGRLMGSSRFFKP